MKAPKILTFDIETTPILAYVWGAYEQNIVRTVRHSYLLTVGYKWLHEKHAKVYSLPDFSTFKKDHTNDHDLALAAWKLLDEADIVITQNGDAFDIKKLNTRFIKHGLPPPSPYRSVDTKRVAKRYFSFTTNKLDNLGDELGLGGKMKHEGFDLWEGCMAGDIKAFKTMAAYNKRDVELTEKVYLAQRPWIATHPNLNIYTEKPEGCPKCLSNNLQSRGERAYSDQTVRKMWRCGDCGACIYGERVPREKLLLK